MTNKIEQFLNEKFGEVGAVKINNVIWFVASDVANVLKYDLTTNMTRNLDDDEKDIQTMNTLGGKQEVLIINESGLYNAVLSITKRNKERYELAKEFKKWITSEVIPTIRETGAYVENNREEEFVSNYFKGLSDDLKFEIVKELKENNEKLQVKATKFDQFLDTDSTYTFTDVAKMISTRASEEYGNTYKVTNKSLPKYLREKGILSKAKSGSSYTNLPNQKFEQYFDVISRKTQGEFEKTQTRVKTSGIDFIYEELVLDGFQLN